MAAILKTWILPFVVGIVLFVLVRPGLAQIAEREQQLRNDLAGGEANVGDEIADGYQQVYYMHDEKKIFVTSGNQNSRDAVSDGEYMAWVQEVNGLGQIILYHIPTDITTQITESGNNLQPRISGNKVVWEGWVDGGWQIFLFDGVRVRQLTSGDTSVHPDIDGDEVVFARRGKGGGWRAVRYRLADGSMEDVISGPQAKFPRFREGRVVFAADEETSEPSAAPTVTTGDVESPAPTASPSVPPAEEGSPEIEVSTSPSPSTSVFPTGSPRGSVSPSPEASVSPMPPEEPLQVTEEDIIRELEQVLPSATPEVSGQEVSTEEKSEAL